MSKPGLSLLTVLATSTPGCWKNKCRPYGICWVAVAYSQGAVDPPTKKVPERGPKRHGHLTKDKKSASQGRQAYSLGLPNNISFTAVADSKGAGVFPRTGTGGIGPYKAKHLERLARAIAHRPPQA